jgi:small subunit ribosomal protein S6
LPANVYECMLLLDSGKYAGDPSGVMGQVNDLFKKNHVEVLASRPWDERKLAYPVKGHKKGTFYLLYLRTEGKNLVPLEQDLRVTTPINDIVLRSLTLKVDPKLVDTLLALARDEHALAIVTPGLQEPPPAAAAPPSANGGEA